jgi:hypothetical protein
MSDDLALARERDRIETALKKMEERRVRRRPIVDAD